MQRISHQTPFKKQGICTDQSYQQTCIASSTVKTCHYTERDILFQFSITSVHKVGLISVESLLLDEACYDALRLKRTAHTRSGVYCYMACEGKTVTPSKTQISQKPSRCCENHLISHSKHKCRYQLCWDERFAGGTHLSKTKTKHHQTYNNSEINELGLCLVLL